MRGAALRVRAGAQVGNEGGQVKQLLLPRHAKGGKEDVPPVSTFPEAVSVQGGRDPRHAGDEALRAHGSYVRQAVARL